MKTFFFSLFFVGIIHPIPADTMSTHGMMHMLARQNNDRIAKVSAAIQSLDVTAESAFSYNSLLSSIIKHFSPDEIADIYRGVSDKGKFAYRLHSIRFSLKNHYLLDKLFPLIKQNFLTLCSEFEGRTIVSDIIENHPNAAQEFFPLVKQNFLALSDSSHGFNIIRSMMLYNSNTAKAVQEFLPLVKQNFLTLCTGRYSSYIVSDILYDNPSAAQEIIPLIEKNFLALSNDHKGSYLVSHIIKNHPNAVQEFLPLVKQNFLTLCTGLYSSYIVSNILDCNPSAAQELIPFIEKDSLAFINSDYGCDIAIKVAQYDSNFAKKITLLASKKEVRPILFSQIIKNIPDQQHTQVEQVLNNASLANDFNLALKAMLYRHYVKNNRLKDDCEVSPSTSHMGKNIDHVLGLISSREQVVQKTIVAGLTKEKELIEQGYVPFVHGRRRRYDFPTQVHAFLNSITTNQQVNNDFILTHIKKRADDLAKEETTREQLIKEGNPFDSKKNTEGIARRQKLLFVNHFIFGNLGRSGSNSFQYMLDNDNATHVHITTKQLFDAYGIDFKLYAAKIEELEKEYNAISRYGQMLQIGITPEKVKKCVYLTSSGGPKVPLKISKDTSSDDIHTILNHLKTDPVDRTEFAIINTFDKNGGLNPHGMKISVLDPADYDPESLAKKIACEKKRNELFAQIERDYKAVPSIHF